VSVAERHRTNGARHFRMEKQSALVSVDTQITLYIKTLNV